MGRDAVYIHPGGSCTPYRMASLTDVYPALASLVVVDGYLKSDVLELSVQESHIIITDSGRGTIETPYRLRRNVMEPLGIEKIYYISCKKHERRARDILAWGFRGYEWEFVPAKDHDCPIEKGWRETLARAEDRLILLVCRIWDRPDIYQTLKEIGPKRLYSLARRFLPR